MTADYLLTQNEKNHLAVLLWLLCPTTPSHTPFRGEVFCHLDLLSFQMVHFVGMPLMCSDTEFYAWSLLKHQKHNWFPIFTLLYLRAFLGGGQRITCTQRTEVIVKLSC